MTTLFPEPEITTAAPIDAPKRKQRSWLPLLTILFCVSYALLTMLVIEQGRTIDQQRALIRELFRDSTELSARKLQDQQRGLQPHAPASKNQTPSAQAQNAPSSQAQQQGTQIERPQPQVESPSRPASDQSEDRRALIRI